MYFVARRPPSRPLSKSHASHPSSEASSSCSTPPSESAEVTADNFASHDSTNTVKRAQKAAASSSASYNLQNASGSVSASQLHDPIPLEANSSSGVKLLSTKGLNGSGGSKWSPKPSKHKSASSSDIQLVGAKPLPDAEEAPAWLLNKSQVTGEASTPLSAMPGDHADSQQRYDISSRTRSEERLDREPDSLPPLRPGIPVADWGPSEVRRWLEACDLAHLTLPAKSGQELLKIDPNNVKVRKAARTTCRPTYYLYHTVVVFLAANREIQF